jgi:hypothetical protein
MFEGEDPTISIPARSNKIDQIEACTITTLDISRDPTEQSTSHENTLFEFNSRATFP